MSDGGQEVDGEPVVSGCYALPVLEPAEHALDDIASAVRGSVEGINDVSRCPARDNGLDALPTEEVPQPIGVISLVCDQPFGWFEANEKWHGHGDVGDISRCQRDGDDPATSIGQTMDFRGSSAPRDADRLRVLPPFPPDAERWAFTWELSSANSSGTGPAAAAAAKMRCQTPRRAQRV